MSASPIDRLVDRARGRALVSARGLFELLNRSRPLRRAGARICRRLAESSVARLRRHPDVAAVFVRGSYGRGDPQPFVSDLDLVVIVREPEGVPALATAQSVQAAIRSEARANPLLRDRWHLVLGESDLGLVSRYATLFGVGEWSGDQPVVTVADTVPRHLSDVATWNRQHMFTDSAFRCALSPAPPNARSLLAFTAAEKKALHHESKLQGTSPVERRALPVDGRELGERCGELVRRLGETAAVLAPAPHSPREGGADTDARASFMEVLRASPIAPEIAAAYRFEGGLALVHEPGADLGTLCANLPAVARTLAQRIVVYAPAATACAPLIGGVAELWRRPGAAGLPEEPAFLREQFIYEALFGGAELRLRASVGSTAQERRQCTMRLMRWLTFLRSGRLFRNDAEAWAAAPPADPADAVAWFTAAASLWLDLRELLSTPVARA